MAALDLKAIHKRFPGGGVAIEEVSLSIAGGEFVVLVGPSGCGKSTLLRIVAGLETATRGEVWIAGRRVDGLPPKDRDVAMVFQSYALYPHMNVFDNIAFGLRARRVARNEVGPRVQAAASLLGITALLGRRPAELSGGERQRVALGRAIVRDPQLFLFDEPLSNLDARLRTQMRAEIAALHRRLGVTTLYVTHDQVEALTMGQRIVVLRAGRVQQIGTPQEVYERPGNLFVAGFIGSPPMNVLPVRVMGAAKHTPAEAGVDRTHDAALRFAEHDLGKVRLPAAFAGRQLLLGIRPQDLRPTDEHGLAITVTLIEPTGGESLIYGVCGEVTLIARATDSGDIQPGDVIRLQADLTRAHFFDPITERRLEL